MLLGFKIPADTNTIIQATESSVGTFNLYAVFNTIAFFSPIAGLMSDVKFSRFKVVINNSCLLLMPFVVAVEYFLLTALESVSMAGLLLQSK